MTPAELKAARHKLGLTGSQMANMLGYKGKHTRVMMNELENGKKTIREPQIRLTRAYLDGYRPNDWPNKK